MKRIAIAIMLGAGLLVAVNSVAAKSKKKPASVYISSAKIEILANKLERLATAEGYLDTLALHYGPHAEGLYWHRKIISDRLEKASLLEMKRELFARLISYNDSLHMCCESDDVKKKYRKNCDKFIKEGDSTLAMYWQELYNAGVEQANEIPDLIKEIEAAGDDLVGKKYYEDRLKALIDTCEYNMETAISINPQNPLPYRGLSKIHKAKGEFEKANEWLMMALDKSEEKGDLQISVAYNYIKMQDFCGAIPFFAAYVDGVSLEGLDAENQKNLLGTMYNLAVCNNNCEKYSEASKVFHRMIDIDSTNVSAVSGLGNYHMEMARWASDSANAANGREDKDAKDSWNVVKKSQFDSASVHLKAVFDAYPDSVRAAEQYGVVSYVNEKFEQAAIAFSRAAELSPNEISNWTSLGDCNLTLKKWPDAVAAYEKVIEIEPDNRQILERLKDLYVETGETAKRKAIIKKLK